MVTNFEEFTCELTEDELKLIKPLISGLKSKNKESPIKADAIVLAMNNFAKEKGLPKISDARLRKLVNYIRSNGILPIIATSKGYYVSYDPKEIQEQVDSLKQRANSILNSANGLSNWII
jgi:carbamoylphosphate synthase small subunit